MRDGRYGVSKPVAGRIVNKIGGVAWIDGETVG
jgi:hypothetical protein